MMLDRILFAFFCLCHLGLSQATVDEARVWAGSMGPGGYDLLIGTHEQARIHKAHS